MASSDPVVRSLVGKIAINSRIAGSPPRSAPPDACIPVDQRASYHAEVDPDGLLPLRQRQRKAAAAFKRDEAAEQLRAYRNRNRNGGDDGGAAA